MNVIGGICKNLGLVAPFFTGLGAVLGLLFNVWKWKKAEAESADRKEDALMPPETPDIITVCSKLDAMQIQQDMLVEMNSTLTALTKSVLTRLDNVDGRLLDLDARLTRLEDKR